MDLAGGGHKQGAYVSELIRRAAQDLTVEVRLRALQHELDALRALVMKEAPHDG